ncbi:cytochrome-c oxidase, cbb3-type subunit III [Wenzhouxiangella sp. XN201]|uniref:cytochrome-c oxidase, cbb3-type subunit III n=1 Tax=Wenzhouxiangella sp. XN201 TaxID=2710755 RepID=UPI0013C63C65|nr:cytochrome-c oxidase, cbb3-type subunit III [Wenzhouxiangella sp. XN201]NEZ04493.1 cytochrome-c oxidase, cbb3-type subunit III [Wenzhouxiangella sp. XN201]
MSAFWHWFVVLITLGFTAAMVWLFIVTGRAQVKAEPHDEGGDTTGHVWDEDLREYNNPMPRWWLWLFYGTVIWSLLYLVLYPGLGRFEGTLGWSQEGQYEEQMARAAAAFEERFAELTEQPLEALVDDADAQRMGRNIFAHNCSTCHGSDARGAEGYPNLTDQHWIWGGAPERVLESIQSGRQAVMPPLGDALGEQGVTRVATYAQKLAGKSVDATMAAAGERLFQQNCAACHGPEGTGNIHLGAPDLTAGIYTYGGDLDSLRETIRQGRNGIMPAQEPLIGEARSRLVAAYVLGLSRDDDE